MDDPKRFFSSTIFPSFWSCCLFYLILGFVVTCGRNGNSFSFVSSTIYSPYELGNLLTTPTLFPWYPLNYLCYDFRGHHFLPGLTSLLLLQHALRFRGHVKEYLERKRTTSRESSPCVAPSPLGRLIGDAKRSQSFGFLLVRPTISSLDKKLIRKRHFAPMHPILVPLALRQDQFPRLVSNIFALPPKS